MRPVLALVLAAALAGCATLQPEPAPGCHGARRPANPNGSVLVSTSAPPAPPSRAGAPGGHCGGPRA